MSRAVFRSDDFKPIYIGYNGGSKLEILEMNKKGSVSWEQSK